MMTGPIWCEDCGFRAEHKEKYNPFLGSGEKSVEVKEFSCGVSTFFCISDSQGKNEIRIPIDELKAFQAIMNTQIDAALKDYEAAEKEDK
jgi:hypothetical protein